jgi:hypothetical protein
MSGRYVKSKNVRQLVKCSEAEWEQRLLGVVGLLHRRPAELSQAQLAITYGGNLLDVWQALAGTGAAL